MSKQLELLAAQLQKQYLPNIASTKTLYVGERKYIIDIPQNQNVGLSFRPEMEREKGMLFIVSPDGKRVNENPKFHMNNMNFPLDFICVGENNDVVHIEKNVQPMPNIIIDLPACSIVIEVNAGDSEGINIGDLISDSYMIKQDGGGGGEGGGGFMTADDAGTTTFSATGSRQKIDASGKPIKKSLDELNKQIAFTNLGQGFGEFTTAPNLPNKSGHRGESDKIREMSERGFLNRAIQDGMTEQEWTIKQNRRANKFERIKDLYEDEPNSESKLKRLENYLHGEERKDPDLYVSKAVTPQQISAARAKGLVPQSGNWNAPVKWVKPKALSPASPPPEGNIPAPEQPKSRGWKSPEAEPKQNDGQAARKELVDKYHRARNTYDDVGTFEFLSETENAALYAYKENSMVNKNLYRTQYGKQLTPDDIALIEELDSAFANESFKVGEPLLTYRGVSNDEFDDIASYFPRPLQEGMEASFKKLSYTSTSESSKKATDFVPFMGNMSERELEENVVEVHIPEGSKAISLDKIYDMGEDEILLPRDTFFKATIIESPLVEEHLTFRLDVISEGDFLGKQINNKYSEYIFSDSFSKNTLESADAEKEKVVNDRDLSKAIIIENKFVCELCPDNCKCVFLNGCACDHDCLCSNFIRQDPENSSLDLSDIIIDIDKLCP